MYDTNEDGYKKEGAIYIKEGKEWSIGSLYLRLWPRGYEFRYWERAFVGERNKPEPILCIEEVLEIRRKRKKRFRRVIKLLTMLAIILILVSAGGLDFYNIVKAAKNAKTVETTQTTLPKKTN